MKTSRFTEEQIVHAIRQAEGGESVIEICRRMGISQQTFYTWKRKYRTSTPNRVLTKSIARSAII